MDAGAHPGACLVGHRLPARRVFGGDLSIEGLISPPLPPGTANALLFVACGMIWSAARIFHGRRVLWGWMFAGAIAWLTACLFPEFAQWAAARIVLSSVIVASYTFLTAAELWRERRKTLLRRWPAIFVPILHGAVSCSDPARQPAAGRWRRP